MKRRDITLPKLLGELATDKNLYLRALLYKDEDTWKIATLIIDNYPQPNRKTSAVYNYGEFCFLFAKTVASKISNWTKSNKAQVNGIEFDFPSLQETIWGERYPSKIKNVNFYSLPVPFSIFQLHRSHSNKRLNYSEPLIADGLPSFPNLITATYHFLYDKEAQSGNSIIDDIIIRQAHTECWIEKIHLHPSAVSIEIKGDDVRGVRLEVKGDKNYFDQKLRKAGIKKLSMPEGLPSKLWVILSRGNQWLDYRNFDLSGAYHLADKDVVIDPPDRCTQINGLISRGEGETIEFKEQISNETKQKFLKTVAAFLNGKGGVILIGVEDETGKIVGVKGDIAKEKDRLSNIIRNNVVPQSKFGIESCNLKGSTVIAIFIEEGDSPPYGLDANKTLYYVRRGATTFHASQYEVRTLANKNSHTIDRDLYSSIWEN